MQMYININHLLKNKNPKKDGYDYISVTKTITNENMAKDHSFSTAEIEELKKQPGIEESSDQPVGAYYVSDSVSRDTNRLAQDSLAELLLVNFFGHELSTLTVGSCLICNADGQRYCGLSGIARVPLFLRDASIRC